jgi:hypothetical protein
MAPDTDGPAIVNDAFISYSRRDKPFAVAIEKALDPACPGYRSVHRVDADGPARPAMTLC